MEYNAYSNLPDPFHSAIIDGKFQARNLAGRSIAEELSQIRFCRIGLLTEGDDGKHFLQSDH